MNDVSLCLHLIAELLIGMGGQPRQLDRAMQGAARKSDMPVQKETGREAHAKGDKDRSNRRRDGLREPMEIDMDVVLMQDIVEAEPIHPDVQQRARTPAGRIPEGLQRHYTAERGIKEINKGGDIVFQLLYHHINLPG